MACDEWSARAAAVVGSRDKIWVKCAKYAKEEGRGVSTNIEYVKWHRLLQYVKCHTHVTVKEGFGRADIYLRRCSLCGWFCTILHGRFHTSYCTTHPWWKDDIRNRSTATWQNSKNLFILHTNNNERYKSLLAKNVVSLLYFFWEAREIALILISSLKFLTFPEVPKRRIFAVFKSCSMRWRSFCYYICGGWCERYSAMIHRSRIFGAVLHL